MPLTYQPFAETPEVDQLVRREDASKGLFNLETNVGLGERMASAFLGSTIAAMFAGRRGIGGFLMTLVGGALVFRGLSGNCQAYQAMGINTTRAGVPGNSGIRVEKSIDIQVPRYEVYRYWRNLENLARFMEHVEQVDILDERRSHWVVAGPAGLSADWEAEIINEHEGSLLAWQSLPGSIVQNAGSVRFEDLPMGGTRVTVKLEFRPPAGQVGAQFAKIMGQSPEKQLEEDLVRFRSLIERR